MTSIFTEGKNESAYLKAGVMGFAGSGKTFTAIRVAVGLYQYIKADKPIFFLDTETGSDFFIEDFGKMGIKLQVCKSRAFVDLVTGIEEAEKHGSVLIIDSITHFWNELMEAYQRKKNITRLTLRDWAPIKQEWRRYTEAYLMSKLHIIMCGRAGWDFGYVEDENGAKELQKTDTKMKVESDTGFEPSLLLEMERIKSEKQKIGSAFTHRCWVLKDRFDKINGHYFDNPTFEDFIPHISRLNLGGEHKVIDTEHSSEGQFNTDRSLAEYYKRRDIILEEIKDCITVMIPGRDMESSAVKIEFLKDIFGTSSWTAISNMKLEDLEPFYARIKAEGMDRIGKITIKVQGKKEEKETKKKGEK